MTDVAEWTVNAIKELYEQPMLDLLFGAQQVHRQWHRPNEIELAALLSIKTGGCPEDCAYCSQSAFANSGVAAGKLLDSAAIVEAARAAKEAGATRFCMGAAWRGPKDRDMPALADMIQDVKALGLETCMTLGMLSEEQAKQLAEAGLDFYNHNLDTSAKHYSKIVTTRTYADRLQTLERARSAGMALCCGGIIGMGESRDDRIEFLATLSALPDPPESVPINALVPVPGTRLGDRIIREPETKLDELELVRTIAVARIVMPGSVIRLSAGRESLGVSTQTLCFLAGANSIFTGEKLLTAANAGQSADAALLEKLGLKAALPRRLMAAE